MKALANGGDAGTVLGDGGVHGGILGTVFKLQPAQRADCLPADMLDGMEGKLTNVKWAAIGKCAVDTALLDISDCWRVGAALV